MNKIFNKMINQKSTSFIIGIMSFCFLACNSDYNSSSTMSSSSSTASAPISAPAPQPATPSAIGTQSSGIVKYPPIRTGQFLSASTTGINPAHGMPGHDCAVAVGAPLPGVAPAPVTAVQNTPIPVQSLPNQLAVPSPNLKTNLKVNPAHGQPGHDCTIAVGAPLGGASTPETAKTEAPVSSANINPAHGKPGHDCSVAVGAPLPSK